MSDEYDYDAIVARARREAGLPLIGPAPGETVEADGGQWEVGSE